MTHEEKVEIYMEIEREYYTEDVRNWCESNDITLTEEQIEDAVETMVWEFDSDITYWDNVEQAVRWAMEKD